MGVFVQVSGIKEKNWSSLLDINQWMMINEKFTFTMKKKGKKKNEEEKFDSNKIPINSVLRELETL